MNVHVPPVVIAAAGFEAQRRMRSRSVSPLRVAAVCTAATAAGLGVASLVTFAQQRTTVNPAQPARASSLVDSGPYAISRNPMYVALIGILAAHALWRGRTLAWVPVVATWAALDRLQVHPEERALAEVFGKDYARYAATTPRWLGSRARRARYSGGWIGADARVHDTPVEGVEVTRR